jgi:hypothetical protein
MTVLADDSRSYDEILSTFQMNHDCISNIADNGVHFINGFADSILSVNNIISNTLIFNAKDKTTCSAEHFIIEKFEWHGKTVYFNQQVSYIIYKESDLFTLDSSFLDIQIFDETKKLAVESFYDEVMFLWEEYAMELDENLTIDGKELKNKVKYYISEVV